jgi:hypothetical protein
MLRGDVPAEHPLLQLAGSPIEGYTLELKVWPARFAGQVEFVAHLLDRGGERTLRPVAEGMYGRTTIPAATGKVERAILDTTFMPRAEFPSRPKGGPEGFLLHKALVGVLSRSLEGAWSAMMYLAYGWKTLKQIQDLGHPLQVTDEGFLLFLHGFRGGWKDYYYSEGWLEGPIKLKAERAPTEEYRRAWDAENAHTLLQFLKRFPADGVMEFREEGSGGVEKVSILAMERTARSRALSILQDLTLDDPTLGQKVRQALAAYPDPEVVSTLSLGELQAFAVKGVELIR